MAPHLIVLLNLIGLFLFDLFLGADISISQNVPPSMAPGSEVRITVVVNKGQLSGFAKLQLDLPDGLTATAIETKGASFTFSDQKAKFIWMALPSTPTFRISYTLSAAPDARGAKEITGRLSYIEDNERKTYDMPAVVVDLGAGAPVAQAVAATEPEVEPVATTEPVEDVPPGDLVSAGGGGVAPVVAMQPAMLEGLGRVAPIQGPGGVSGIRTVTPITASEVLVEVTINKGDIRGFGKLQETIPMGFTATEKKSDDAIFTTQDRIVKFVWLNLPGRSEVKVSYKMRAANLPDGEYTIDGEFGYLLNEETQKSVLGSTRFMFGQRALDMIAATGTQLSGEQNTDVELALRDKPRPTEAPVKTQPETKPEPKPTPKPKETKPTTPPQQKTSTPRVPSPERGITYKVQIMAAHREVGGTYMRSMHRYSGDFSIERHQGWIKYVTGSFGTYRDARDRRVSLVDAGHKFPGPFVTAYQDGTRITVQEALAISGQQWVQ
jgi:hypothetical protein